MTYIKWIASALLAVIILAFLHYTLPQRDIVHIVGTEVKRVDVNDSWTKIFWASPDAGQSTNTPTRDVRFVNTELPNGDPYVYRNEDTEWSWPPYFKFDSGDLTAEAQSLAKQDKRWVAVKHYGWRIPLISIYPNAISMKKVDGPDVFLIPWFNIIFFIILGIILFFIIRTILRFKAKRIDPVLEDIDEMVDDVSDSAAAARAEVEATGSGILGTVQAWFKKWFGSSAKK